MKKSNILILGLLIVSMYCGNLAFAQVPGSELGGSSGGELGGGSGAELGGSSGKSPLTIGNPIQAKTINQLFEDIIDILLVFAVPIIVFFIIYAGFLYVTAQGNESTIQKAHMALLYALVGGVLILGAKVLITVIGGTVDTFYK